MVVHNHLCMSFGMADQPGMLCSFKISTAWSSAWCLNPLADKTFSTGEYQDPCIIFGYILCLCECVKGRETLNTLCLVIPRSLAARDCDECCDWSEADIQHQQ